MADDSPHVGSVRVGPATGGVLFVLLGLSAAVALWGDSWGALPASVPAMAPYAFGLFLTVFTTYRFALVRAGRYPAGKAYYQVGAGVLFLTLLTPAARRAFRGGAGGGDDAVRLLSSPDPAVRRLVCEAVGYRGDAGSLIGLIQEHADDPDPGVRAECIGALRKLGR